MEIYLSKFLPVFVYPLGLGLVMAILAGLLISRFRVAGRALLWGAVTLLWVASTPVFSDYLRSTLEWRHLPLALEGYPRADAIVVLGGMVQGAEPPRVEREFSDAVDRLLHAAALGADHQRFAEAGARLWGIDLTERAVEHTRRRLTELGFESRLSTGDAERLEFDDESFDYVYSWGVLHHSPDTRGAIAEVYRVLRKGGVARVMIYHKWSLVGLMLWVRYGLLGLRPWMTLDQVYGRYLESPGTKAYSRREARELYLPV
ncbi:MAG: class I SAM-dependent methyltransferase [Pseudomonadota bacterium]|nr:class I SAM-dependent methyltransferase [Pseudomonadota bacterium]